MFLFFILVQHFYYKNEFLKMSMARKIFEYCCMIIKTFELLKSLYNLGARKFGIIGVPPVGCCPSQRIHNITRGCFEIENTFALAFHSSLDTLLKKLSCKLSGMKYSLGNYMKWRWMSSSTHNYSVSTKSKPLRHTIAFS